MISVFTPSHDPKYLNDCYRSLAMQNYTQWQWVVLLNGKNQEWTPPQQDPRVMVIKLESNELKGVGAVKAAAVEMCEGEVIVELDHDDWLLPNCLHEINKAYQKNPNAAFFFSDFAYVNEDGSPSSMRYQGRWNYSSEEVYGQMFHRCHSQYPIPENVAIIWYAPNHVRAFTRKAYDAAGGYDIDYEILDDQDLMTRLFIVGEFVHIDKMLYLQRMHESNTQFDPHTNAEIQRRTIEIYKERIGPMTEAYVNRLLAARGCKCND